MLVSFGHFFLKSDQVKTRLYLRPNSFVKTKSQAYMQYDSTVCLLGIMCTFCRILEHALGVNNSNKQVAS